MGRVTINTGGTHSFVYESQDRRGDPSYRPYKLINNEKIFYEIIHDKTVYYDLLSHGEKRYFGFVKGSKVYYDSDKAMSLLNQTASREFKKWIKDQKDKREAKHLKQKKVAQAQKSKHGEKRENPVKKFFNKIFNKFRKFRL